MKNPAKPLSELLSSAEEEPTLPPPSFGLSLRKQPEPPLTGDPSKDIAALSLYNLQRLNALSEAIESKLPDCLGAKERDSLIGHLLNSRSKAVRLGTQAVDDIAGAIGKKVKHTVEAE